MLVYCITCALDILGSRKRGAATANERRMRLSVVRCMLVFVLVGLPAVLTFLLLALSELPAITTINKHTLSSSSNSPQSSSMPELRTSLSSSFSFPAWDGECKGKPFIDPTTHIHAGMGMVGAARLHQGIAAIRSLFFHKSCNVTLHVLCDRKTCLSLAKYFGLSVDFAGASPLGHDGLAPRIGGGALAPGTSLLFYDFAPVPAHFDDIPNSFEWSAMWKASPEQVYPQNIDVLLHLDIDVVFVDDICIQWKREVAVFGAEPTGQTPLVRLAPDRGDLYEVERKEWPGFEVAPGMRGLNSGVVLSHLLRMRESNWTHRWKTIVKQCAQARTKAPWGDQDVFNQVATVEPQFFGPPLPFSWNFPAWASPIPWPGDALGWTKGSLVLIHYATGSGRSSNPWNFFNDIWASEEWSFENNPIASPTLGSHTSSIERTEETRRREMCQFRRMSPLLAEMMNYAVGTRIGEDKPKHMKEKQHNAPSEGRLVLSLGERNLRISTKQARNGMNRLAAACNKAMGSRRPPDRLLFVLVLGCLALLFCLMLTFSTKQNNNRETPEAVSFGRSSLHEASAGGWEGGCKGKAFSDPTTSISMGIAMVGTSRLHQGLAAIRSLFFHKTCDITLHVLCDQETCSRLASLFGLPLHARPAHAEHDGLAPSWGGGTFAPGSSMFFYDFTPVPAHFADIPDSFDWPLMWKTSPEVVYPQNIEFFMHLDIDIIFVDDICPSWSHEISAFHRGPLQTAMMRFAPDRGHVYRPEREWPGFEVAPNVRGFNCGIGLFHLPRMRQTNWTHRWKSIIKQLVQERTALPWSDQDVFNQVAILEPTVFGPPLPFSWNFPAWRTYWPGDALGWTKGAITLVHFAAKSGQPDNPWNFFNDIWASEEWSYEGNPIVSPTLGSHPMSASLVRDKDGKRRKVCEFREMSPLLAETLNYAVASPLIRQLEHKSIGKKVLQRTEANKEDFDGGEQRKEATSAAARLAELSLAEVGRLPPTLLAASAGGWEGGCKGKAFSDPTTSISMGIAMVGTSRLHQGLAAIRSLFFHKTCDITLHVLCDQETCSRLASLFGLPLHARPAHAEHDGLAPSWGGGTFAPGSSMFFYDFTPVPAHFADIPDSFGWPLMWKTSPEVVYPQNIEFFMHLDIDIIFVDDICPSWNHEISALREEPGQK
ncbi:hypothetical protein QOT17_025290, partial [Balamuthia mandrillaris]